jgi:hypothetical protein
MARQGYALIARIDSVHSEEAVTTDDPPASAQFIVAQGRCLELLYVGRHYPTSVADREADLRLNTSEDEKRARLEMKLQKEMERLTQEMGHKKD